MFDLHPFKRGKSRDSVGEIIEKIQSGDKHLKDKFINDYKPFILKTVSKETGRYIDVENSEEFSIGLLAFNEAIDCYDSSKRNKFVNFSEQVIKRRIIDYSRREKRENFTLPFSYFQNQNGEGDDGEHSENTKFEEKYLKSDSVHMAENMESKEEIKLLAKKLLEFGFTLRDVGLSAPKHKDSKQLGIRIAKLIANNNELFEKLLRKKSIPMNDLTKITDVHFKTIEKNRKFIIGMCLVLRSNLNVMKRYVDMLEKGGNNDD
ncbi:MAG: RNA polymerase sigma-I factor [Clostridia bacterium]|nr:RNA polymerase sigma-I factor [Clostridia bacterium]